MKKKEDVYVVVDSRKKAIELEGVLKMFGEATFNYDSIEQCLRIDGFLVFSEFYGSWFAASSMGSRTQVSIQELKNILAKEYLKEGDVALFKDGDTEFLSVFDSVSIVFDGQFRVSDMLIEGRSHGAGVVEDFIRFATEEEKGLFNHNIVDEDVAIIERLHDTLLDNHGYSLDSKLLTDARTLANKLKKQ